MEVGLLRRKSPTASCLPLSTCLSVGNLSLYIQPVSLLPVYEDKRKLITGGIVKNKIPSKLVIHCKDLRVFQFTLTYCLVEEAKRVGPRTTTTVLLHATLHILLNTTIYYYILFYTTSFLCVCVICVILSDLICVCYRVILCVCVKQCSMCICASRRSSRASLTTAWSPSL